MKDNNIVYIDLANQNITIEQITEEQRRKYIGGAGLSTKLLFDSKAMMYDALSEHNVLIFGVGVGVGTGILTGNRSVITAKSPVTDLYGDSNIGGNFPITLRRIGIDHLVFQNKSEKPVYVYINANQEISFYDANEVWGMHTDQATDYLIEKHGNVEVACIGTAGENECRFANVAMSKTHFAGRMGMGCVMGSKKLKAIVIEKTTKSVPVYNLDKIKELNKQWLEVTKTSVNFKMMQLQGTLLLVKQYSEMGSLPINNCTANTDERMSNLYAPIFQAKYETKRSPCEYCALGCGKQFEVKQGRFKGEKGSRIEYGSVASLGPAIGIFDYGDIIHLKLLGDKIGVDSIEVSACIALLFEMQSRGLLPEKYQNEKLFQFGSVDGAEYIMNLITSDDELGQIMKEGAYRASKVLHGEKYVFCIKKSASGLQSVKRKAWALGYLTSTRGGDHLKDFPFTSILGGHFAEVTAKHIFNRDFKGTYDKPEEKGRVVWWHENYKYILDSIGVCLFGMHALVTQGYGYFDQMAELFEAVSGVTVTEKELFYAGERIYQLQNAFNVLSGLTFEDYKFPTRDAKDSNNQQYIEETTFKTTHHKGMLPEYFWFRGLTPEGKPTAARFEEVDLDEYKDFISLSQEKIGDLEEQLKEVNLSIKLTFGERLRSKIIYKIVDKNVKKGMKKAEAAKKLAIQKQQEMMKMQQMSGNKPEQAQK